MDIPKKIILPKKLSEFVQDYLSPLNIGTPKDSLINTTFSLIGYVAGLNRVKVKSSLISTIDHLAPANYYGVTFLPSGAGKDKPVTIIDKNIIIDIRADFKKKAQDEYTAKKALVNAKAEEMFGEKDSAAKKEYIREHMPRYLNDRMSDATPEGLNDTRKAFQMTDWGGTFLKVQELSDFILSDRADRKDLLSLLKDIWEFGDSEAKNIKGDKEPVSISGIPHSAMLHSSIEGLKDGKGRQRFMHFLNTGLARRCFLAYPQTEEEPKSELSTRERALQEIQSEEQALSRTQEFKELFDRAYQATRKTTIYGQNNIFTMDETADMYLREYRIVCRDIKDQMPSEGDDSGLRTEVENRWSKVLRLSGLVAFISHPDDKTVYIDDVKCAVSYAEQLGEQIARFYEPPKEDSDADKLLEVFLNNIGKPLSKTDLRAEGLVHANKFAQWLHNTLPLCTELALDMGYKIIRETKERGRQEYTLKKIETLEDKVHFSVGKSNRKEETHFTPSEIDFNQIHTITGGNVAWSCPLQYKNNHRADDNAIEGIEMIALDIDKDMTIKQARQALKKHNVKALISTTKSHQKQKDTQPPCDRFRIVIPLKYKWHGNKHEYKHLMRGVVSYLGLKTDPSTINISRLWYANPEHEYFYTQGEPMDYYKYTPTMEEAPKREIVKYTNEGKGITAMAEFFSQNYAKHGGRNNTLYVASQFFKNDKGLPAQDVISLIWQINNNFDEPLTEQEVRCTVLRSNGWA